MSYKLQYIGPTQTIKASSLRDPNDSINIDLKKDEQYTVELQNDGPITIINNQNQTIIPPDSTIWIIFPFSGGCIPYSPEAILKQWKMI